MILKLEQSFLKDRCQSWEPILESQRYSFTYPIRDKFSAKKEYLMRHKFSFLLVILVAALLLSACGTNASSGQQPRLLNVNGQAQIQLTPDIAYISIGVHTEAQTAEEAVASNNSQAQAVMNALQEAGIAEEDIRTSNFSIYPYEKWGPNNESLGTYYSVDNMVYITVRDIDSLGAVIDAAISAGATNISGISFDVEDKASVIAEARTLAVADARAQAEMLAEAASVTLGEVYSINYYNTYPVAVYGDVKGVGGGADMGVPIASGQMTLTVDVNMAFIIK
jgi:uncharacterized protein YggE